MNITAVLRRIAAIKGEINCWTSRVIGSITYEAADPPAYSFEEAFSARRTLVKELVQLQTALAIANATTMIQWKDKGITLATAIRELQEVKSEISLLSGLSAHTRADYKVKEDGPNYIRERGQFEQIEVAMKCDFVERDRDAAVTDLRKRFAELNLLVEAANHGTTLSP